MRAPIRGLLLLSLAAGSLSASGQAIHVERPSAAERLYARDLQERTASVSGQGSHVPGVDLEDEGEPRHLIGDDTAFAGRAFIDTLWSELGWSVDSVVPRSGVHWVRYHVLPESGLKKVPLMLSVEANARFDLFLNGRSLLRSDGASDNGSERLFSSSVSRLSLPVTFACDGKPEVLAVRIAGAPGGSLRSASLHVSLHAATTSYTMQRTMLHFGVFIGINIVLLLFSVVIWANERGERSWLLLALLSLVSAVDTFCEPGGAMAALGLSAGAVHDLRSLQLILLPWPMYLLIMVLGMMQGDLSPRRVRRYTVAAILVTLICGALAYYVRAGLADTSEGLNFIDASTGLMVAVAVLGLALVAILGWFAFDLVKLGIRLLRSKGYARWIGAGALASSLLALALKLTSDVTGVGLSSWLKVIADYCSYVAVPVSVAVYLAIRSAHHNRLVARQRDELDEEVKERTAQLSMEKERSDALLLNILPAEVAEELKRTGAAEARHFDQASVLFTDFKGFTSMTERVDPTELLQELNTCFKAFDDIIGMHGIEKIKTIGDAYMCVGGLPDPSSSTPVAVVHAALAMQAFMVARRNERDAQGKPAFEMRVGIHTGPVVAGIVGVKKFQYDIWGDTVNTASRMESSGEVGQVNISESTYALVKDEPGLRFNPRGKVQAKGKGEMEMYYVERA